MKAGLSTGARMRVWRRAGLFLWLAAIGLVRPVGAYDDTFDDNALDPAWTVIDRDGVAGGGAAETGGRLRVWGRGYELWGGVARYVGVRRLDVTGDFDVSVKVVSMTNTHEWAKAGIMVANDLDDLSKGGYMIAGVSPQARGALWDWDANNDGATESHVNLGRALSFGDLWLRVKKAGTAFSVYFKESAGASWAELGTSRTISSAWPNSQICLFAFSHDDARTCTAVFDNYTDGRSPLPSVSFATSVKLVNEFDQSPLGGNPCDGLFTIDLTLSRASTAPVTVDLVIAGGTADLTDHDLRPHTITIAAGQTSVSDTAHVVGDYFIEGDESILLTMGAVANAVKGPLSSSTVTIVDNDLVSELGQVFLLSPDLTMEEGARTLTVNAGFTGKSYGPVTMSWSVSGSSTAGEEYAPAAGTVGFDDSRYGRNKSFSLNLFDDRVREGTETVVVRIVSVSGGVAIGRSTVTYTITDNEADTSWVMIDNDKVDGGSAALHNGVFTISGRGNELWGADNDFVGLCRSDMAGDFDVRVRVVSMTNTHEWAKAGIMVADSLDNLAAGGYLLMAATPQGRGVISDWDADGNGASESHVNLGRAASAGDLWLRVIKHGTVFQTLYRENRAGPWVSLGMPRTIASAANRSQICLFAFSHDNARPCTAVLDSFAADWSFMPSRVDNGGFEAIVNGIPRSWRSEAWSPSSGLFSVGAGQGRFGTTAAVINASGVNDARWIQDLTVQSGVPYVVKGWIKGDNVQWSQTGNAAQVGANLCVMGGWNKAPAAAPLLGTFDWTPLEIRLIGDASGTASVAGRLGYYSSLASGTIWIDDVSAVMDTAMRRRIGARIGLWLEGADMSVITEENMARWISHLDAVYAACLDLTGFTPFGGAQVDVLSVRDYPGGWAVAGNPILWCQSFVREELARCNNDDNWSFGIAHEISHDFDSEKWNFDAEMFANLKMYRAIQQYGGKVRQTSPVAGARYYVGAELEQFYKDLYDQLNARHDANGGYEGYGDCVCYRLITVSNTIGWEPYRRTFRDFLAMSPSQVPTTRVGKFDLFLDRLSANSSRQVRELLAAGDLDEFRAYLQQ